MGCEVEVNPEQGSVGTRVKLPSDLGCVFWGWGWQWGVWLRFGSSAMGWWLWFGLLQGKSSQQPSLERPGWVFPLVRRFLGWHSLWRLRLHGGQEESPEVASQLTRTINVAITGSWTHPFSQWVVTYLFWFSHVCWSWIHPQFGFHHCCCCDGLGEEDGLGVWEHPTVVVLELLVTMQQFWEDLLLQMGHHLVGRPTAKAVLAVAASTGWIRKAIGTTGSKSLAWGRPRSFDVSSDVPLLSSFVLNSCWWLHSTWIFYFVPWQFIIKYYQTTIGENMFCLFQASYANPRYLVLFHKPLEGSCHEPSRKNCCWLQNSLLPLVFWGNQTCCYPHIYWLY